jgi:DNA/RNA endonuclease YhcR with UshA esterase domain
MSRKLQGLGLAALLALMLNAGPAHAQATAATAKSTSPLGYDVSKEVTLSANVQSVPSKSSHGLTPESGTQSGFVLQTTAGTIQGRLTYSALNGEGALSITPGEHVQVTGMIATMKNNTRVIVIRTIQVGGRNYTIRNERGFPVAHPALNGSATTVSKGGQL